MENVLAAARELVSVSKVTTALHAEVEKLEAAIVEYDGGAPAPAPKPQRKSRASK